MRADSSSASGMLVSMNCFIKYSPREEAKAGRIRAEKVLIICSLVMMRKLGTWVTAVLNIRDSTMIRKIRFCPGK